MALTINQALQKGILAHKAGELEKADGYYSLILKAYPEHPDANHNTGILALDAGKTEKAIHFFEAAINARKDVEQYWLSYIKALIMLRRFEHAKISLEKARGSGLQSRALEQLDLDLQSAKANSHLLPSQPELDQVLKLYNAGKFDDALKTGSILTNIYPDNAVLANIIGGVFNGLGLFSKSINWFSRATLLRHDFYDAYKNLGIVSSKISKNDLSYISFIRAVLLQPSDTTIYNSIGLLLTNLNRPSEAIDNYRRGLLINSRHAETHNNIGLFFKNEGRVDKAIEYYRKAIDLKPEFPEAYFNLASSLIKLKPTYYSDNLAKLYQDVLDREKFVHTTQMVDSVLMLLKHNNIIRNAIGTVKNQSVRNNPSELCIQLAGIPLFLKIIEDCPIPDLSIEMMLKNLRKALLLERKNLRSSEELLRFQCSLALQCFTNEYIYSETKEEKDDVDKLESEIESCFLANHELQPNDVACLACYRPIHKYSWTNQISKLTGLKKLYQRQVKEVNEESLLCKIIPKLGSVTDTVSLSVQNQYENNPYPRWVSTRVNFPVTISKFLAESELLSIYPEKPFADKPQILVAGCGTGRQAISTASIFRGSHVTAIDLSLTSLGYAKRKAKQLEIHNLEYLQADLLEARSLNKKFDIIECCGVLHHMKDPVEGWKVLVDCLQPNGIMKIGLYSAIARQHIMKARRLIEERKISTKKEDMINFRDEIIKHNKLNLRNLLQSTPDFFSTSSLRDLLFHVQEHRFNIPDIRQLIKQLGLEFIGFDLQNEETRNIFLSTYSQKNALYDLDKWENFEQSHTRTFAGMYNFWTQNTKDL